MRATIRVEFTLLSKLQGGIAVRYNKRILSIVLVLVLVLSNVTVFASKATTNINELKWIEGPNIGETKIRR